MRGRSTSSLHLLYIPIMEYINPFRTFLVCVVFLWCVLKNRLIHKCFSNNNIAQMGLALIDSVLICSLRYLDRRLSHPACGREARGTQSPAGAATSNSGRGAGRDGVTTTRPGHFQRPSPSANPVGMWKGSHVSPRDSRRDGCRALPRTYGSDCHRPHWNRRLR